MTELDQQLPQDYEVISDSLRTFEMPLRFRPSLALVATMALLSPAAVAYAEPKPIEIAGDAPEVVLSEVPHMEIGVTDDGSAKNNHNNTREMAMDAGLEMGATVWRSIVYPHEFQDPELVKMYDNLVEVAFEKGYKVHLTLACNDRRWTPEEFAGYAVQVMRRYGDKVVRYSICNEPNYKYNPSGGVYSPSGKVDPEGYRLIYDKTSKTMKAEAKRQNRKVEVLALELGSGVRAWEFLERFLACPDPRLKQIDCAVTTDGIALHLYQFTTTPTRPDTGGVEIGSLDKIEDYIDAAYVMGLIKTWDGERPKTFATELGYMNENSSGKWDDEGLKEWKRERFFRRAESVGCADKNLAAWMIHGLVNTPEYSDSPWDTGIVSQSGVKSRSFYAIREYTAKHTECIVK